MLSFTFSNAPHDASDSKAGRVFNYDTNNGLRLCPFFEMPGQLGVSFSIPHRYLAVCVELKLFYVMIVLFESNLFKVLSRF